MRLLLQGNPWLPGVLLAVAGFVALGASEAGHRPTAWYPAALLVLALCVIAVAALGRVAPPPRAVVLAVGLFSAYAAWAYLSITWAENQAIAWDGANRAAMYALILAIFSLWPLDARGSRIVLATLGLGLAGVGLVELLKANSSANPLGYFIDVRFAEPAGYINANVALWTVGLFPCLGVAAAREAHPALRALCLGGAGLLASLALLGQSRGWVLAVPLALLLWLAISPRRVRAAIVGGAVTVGVLAVSGPILAVHDEFSRAKMDGLLSDATGAILAMVAALVAVGAVIAIADRRIRPSTEQLGRLRRATAVATAAIVVVGVVGFLAVKGSPLTPIGDAWDDFKGGGQQAEVGQSRFTTAGTNRYDFWTVAWDLFEDKPLNGIGVENFQAEYLRRGNSGEQPDYPHSLEMGVLSQTGLVGALLLLGAFAACIVAAIGALRSNRVPVAAAAAAGVATFAYWLAHASVDWFWEFPGLTAPAIAMLGLAAGLAPRTGEPRRLAPGGRLGVAAAAGAAVLALSFVAPWRAEVEVSRGLDGWRSDIQGAFTHLDNARRLNPLATEPDLAAGTIALRTDDLVAAKGYFEDVLDRQPRSEFALLQLGLLAAEEQRYDEAEALIERSRRESPRDDIITGALEDLRAGRRVNAAQVNRRILERARARRR